MLDFNTTVKDHFLHPRNVGEMEDADAVGEVGSIQCGDALTLYLRLDSARERIAEARFQTFGCASAIASASALTELLTGISLDAAARLTHRDILNYLGELPEDKVHCSVRGMEALRSALSRLEKRRA